MAHRKQGGAARSFRDSNPQYLGIKISDGQSVRAGGIIVRQRGTRIMSGNNVGVGKDHTLYALKDGIASYGTKRKKGFDGTTTRKRTVSVKSN
ncbi:50S ribosomal protein L27 [Candidatus Nomurabacteria bacterium RIFCSPLOWO2_01_FULL_36_10b]|uniref:Large ribosomal subunit protein bL27 n=1 Tax=Candidatus Nomurabacteria bacterium RIFCSPLOWO2_01_FULL_36_10b TaxID=1801766 RepID=A0A1F6WPG3_9BACT|nr:MAG: 50S ribosomal protein L27 [Candidatus Nomurabacteria bacterium RIFCSPLOWO2_01_FULL_36_10b]